MAIELTVANGTILPQRRPSEEDLSTFALSGADLTGNTYYDPIISDEYMKAFKAAQPYSKKMDASMGGLEFMMPPKRMQLDLGDTLGGGIHTIKLDTPQGYQSNIRHGTGAGLVRDDVAKWWDPSSVTTTPWGEEKYLKEPHLLAKTMGHLTSQLGGAAEEGILGNFFRNPKQTLEDYLSNFAGTSQTDYYTTPEQKAAQLAEYYSGEGFIPNTLASLASENWKSLDRDELAKNIIQPDGSVMTMGPNFNYGNVKADEMPNQIDRFRNTVGPNPTETILPQKKPFQYNYDIADAFTADEMATQPIDELTEDEGIPGTTKWQRFLSALTRQPYRAATTGAGGKTAAQLNMMNALGGWYSEPARAQRRLEKRRLNVLNRAAKGKAIGNVNKLLGQYGYSQDAAGNLQFTGGDNTPSVGQQTSGRSDSSWKNDPFAHGGLATMFERRR